MNHLIWCLTHASEHLYFSATPSCIRCSHIAPLNDWNAQFKRMVGMHSFWAVTCAREVCSRTQPKLPERISKASKKERGFTLLHGVLQSLKHLKERLLSSLPITTSRRVTMMLEECLCIFTSTSDHSLVTSRPLVFGRHPFFQGFQASCKSLFHSLG